MEQGFVSSEGFAPSAAVGKAGEVLRGATRSGHAPAKPQAHDVVNSAAEATAKGVALYDHAAKGEREAEASLRNTQSKLMMPGMLQLGALVSTPLMWATQKLPRVKATIGSVFKASSDALDKTKITELGQLPAKYMTAVAEQATEAGAGKWAAGATAKAADLTVSGAKVQSKVAEFAKPVTSAISGAFERFSRTGFAKATPEIVKNALGRVRGASVFQVLMTAGVAVGVAATLVGSRAEKKETKAAFDALMKDIGGDKNSAFAKAVKQNFAEKKKTNLTKTGIELASGALEGVMWAAPGVGGMKMMGAMAVPQLAQMLVPESPTLGAYVALSKADAGEIKLDYATHVDLVKEIMAIKPNVAANGGKYNRLVTPLAKEIVDRKMSAKQFVQLLNDDKAFTALADEVATKQKEAKAAALAGKGAVAANDAHMGHEPVKAVAKESVVAGMPEAANAPSLKLAAGERIHHGTVAMNQRQVG